MTLIFPTYLPMISGGDSDSSEDNNALKDETQNTQGNENMNPLQNQNFPFSFQNAGPRGQLAIINEVGDSKNRKKKIIVPSSVKKKQR